MPYSSICVFAASSRRIHPDYAAAARLLGRSIASRGITLVTGGGSTGLMGAVTDGALEASGRVIGVMPRFMHNVEVAHPRIDMRQVDDMAARLDGMLELSEAFIALPGGCGTLEEVFLVMTRKRLGRHDGPLCLVNQRGYFDPLIAMLQRMISEGFMDDRHAHLWTVAPDAASALDALSAAPRWSRDHARFAVP